MIALKQLFSGLLLVSGPFQLNNVPLTRVNQSHVIATSTSVDISGVKVDVDDKYFAKATQAATKGPDGKFIKTDAVRFIPIPTQRYSSFLGSTYLSRPLTHTSPHTEARC